MTFTSALGKSMGVLKECESESGSRGAAVAGLTISPSCDAREVPEVGSLALGDLADPEVIVQMETTADVVPQWGLH